MLDKIRIQREVNMKVEEMVNKVLSLIPVDSTIAYESSKAEFVIGDLLDLDSTYIKKSSFDLELRKEIEEFISLLKKDILSTNTISITVCVGDKSNVVINMEELVEFKAMLKKLQENLWDEAIANLTW